MSRYPLASENKAVCHKAKIIPLQQVTEGQAITGQIGLEEENLEDSVIIGAYDNGMLWN